MGIFGKSKPTWWYGKDARDNREGDPREDLLLEQIHDAHVAAQKRMDDAAKERARHYSSDWRDVVERQSRQDVQSPAIALSPRNYATLDDLPDRPVDAEIAARRGAGQSMCVRAVQTSSDMV